MNLLHKKTTDFATSKLNLEHLQRELDDIKNKISVFESILRSYLSDLIITEQELFVMYKQHKLNKKLKRLEQKKRGKNYVGVSSIVNTDIKLEKIEDPKLSKHRKKLYREAMLHVHPDKFNLNEQLIDTATDLTYRLIDIYKSGSLEQLIMFHNYVFSGKAISNLEGVITSNDNDDLYLINETEKIKNEIERLKHTRVYIVITEYNKPLDFVDELKTYYEDRINKLLKRTRKIRK